VRLARLGLLAGVVWLVWITLAAQWSDLRSQPLTLQPRWGTILLSAAVVLLAYALLVELWRTLLRAWGERIGIPAAARVWFVSSLGRFVPGRIWQVGAMAVLAGRAGVSPVAATGSAIVNTLVNIATGMVVAVATGAALLDRALVEGGAGGAGGGVGYLRPSEIAMLLAAAGLLGLFTLPWLLPVLGRMAGRLTRRQVELPRVSPVTLWILVAGHTAGWILYGIAFQLLAGGVLGETTGATTAYVAVFTASYIAGYLALLTPGGLVVREIAMIAALTGAGLTGPAEAAVLAVASRIWLTVLEVLPGTVFMAVDAARPSSSRFHTDRAP